MVLAALPEAEARSPAINVKIKFNGEYHLGPQRMVEPFEIEVDEVESISHGFVGVTVNLRNGKSICTPANEPVRFVSNMKSCNSVDR